MNTTKQLKNLVKKTITDPIFDELYEQHEQRKSNRFFASLRQKSTFEQMKTKSIIA